MCDTRKSNLILLLLVEDATCSEFEIESRLDNWYQDLNTDANKSINERNMAMC